MVWAYSSVVEHYVDIVGVPSSNLGTPTIEAFRGSKKPAESAGFFMVRAKGNGGLRTLAGYFVTQLWPR